MDVHLTIVTGFLVALVVSGGLDLVEHSLHALGAGLGQAEHWEAGDLAEVGGALDLLHLLGQHVRPVKEVSLDDVLAEVNTRGAEVLGSRGLLTLSGGRLGRRSFV